MPYLLPQMTPQVNVRSQREGIILESLLIGGITLLHQPCQFSGRVNQHFARRIGRIACRLGDCLSVPDGNQVFFGLRCVPFLGNLAIHIAVVKVAVCAFNVGVIISLQGHIGNGFGRFLIQRDSDVLHICRNRWCDDVAGGKPVAGHHLTDTGKSMGNCSIGNLIDAPIRNIELAGLGKDDG